MRQILKEIRELDLIEIIIVLIIILLPFDFFIEGLFPLSVFHG